MTGVRSFLDWEFGFGVHRTGTSLEGWTIARMKEGRPGSVIYVFFCSFLVTNRLQQNPDIYKMQQPKLALRIVQ